MSEYRSKNKKSKCGYCGIEMLDDNLKSHCRNIHKKDKLVKGQQTLFSHMSGEPKTKKKRISTSSTETTSNNDCYANENLSDCDEVERNNLNTSVGDSGDSTLLHATMCTQLELTNMIGSKEEIPKRSDYNPSEYMTKLENIESELIKLNLKIPDNLANDLNNIKVSSKATSESVSDGMTNVSAVENEKLFLCKTVKQLCETFDHLDYLSQEKCLVCSVCITVSRLAGSHSPGRYAYDLSNDELYITTNIMSREFRNLKTHIKRHFENDDHIKRVEDRNKEEVAQSKTETREFSIGMRIARISYSMYKDGSAKRSFETEILKAALNGTDVGDINHSKEFTSNFRPYVAAEVNRCLSEFFQSRLKKTGFKPPINVQADKGTNCHRTRQFKSAVTIVPHSPNLITFVCLGQPVVKEHDGVGIANSIVEQLQFWKIEGSQIEGGSFDGQYFHLNVPSHMSDLLDLPAQFECTWDPLHKGGLVDTHIRADETFFWLVEIQSTCKSIYNMFNWGKNYEELIQVCENMELSMKNLTNFQTTRFANSVRFVFINLREDYPALRQSIANLIKSKETSSNPEERKKANEAKAINRTINSWTFCLCLSGCADLYDLYGLFANVCQKVEILPHERYDKAVLLIQKFLTMMKCIDHADCPVSTTENNNTCLWPRYHKDLAKLKKDGCYMMAKIDHTNMAHLSQTRLQSIAGNMEIADGIALVKERLTLLSWRLNNDLSQKVFDDDVKKLIEDIRIVSDLKNIILNVMKKGSVLFGIESSRNS